MDEATVKTDDDIDLNVITDEEANELYMKVSMQSAGRKGYVKKNWNEEETKLLKWAVLTYTRQRSITYHALVSIKIKLVIALRCIHTISLRLDKY